MKCDDYCDRLWDLIDGDREALRHAVDCPACLGETRDALRLDGTLAGMTDPPPAPAFAERVISRLPPAPVRGYGREFLRIAAAALIALSAFAAFLTWEEPAIREVRDALSREVAEVSVAVEQTLGSATDLLRSER